VNVFGFGGIERRYLPNTKHSCGATPPHAVTSVFLIQTEASVDSDTLGTVGVKELDFRAFFVIL
jgi:hypothetical protein